MKFNKACQQRSLCGLDLKSTRNKLLALVAGLGSKETYKHIEMVLFISGMAQMLFGWRCFRHPGISFWTFAPIWHASKYLLPAGVALSVGSLVLVWVGAIVTLTEKLPGFFGYAP